MRVPFSPPTGAIALASAFVLMCGTASPLAAQATVKPAPSAANAEIGFAADSLDYDSEAEIVTARGSVVMRRDGNQLEADQVTWNRKTGVVRAAGKVRVTSSGGDIAYGDDIELSESLKDGVVDNLLIVLADGGRLAAVRGSRSNGASDLERAAYSPCRVVDDNGCPIDPVWRITALRVHHDPVKNRISYKNARLELFGVPVLLLPGFSHPADLRGGSGLLVPDLRYSRTNGFEVSVPAYFVIAPDRDLTLTPHVFTNTFPALEARYRVLAGRGAYQIGGFATYASRIAVSGNSTAASRDFRGYLEASGKFQLDRRWSITGAARLVTDRTFLRRYDVSRDDQLRNVLRVERMSRSSLFSVSGWAFQTLRPLDVQGRIPIALPMIDYRKRFNEVAGGRAELQLNSLALTRTQGQDTQRAFAGGRWDARRLTATGQELIFTGYGRADIYHTDEVASTTTALYRGTSGWHSRAIAAAAAEVRWPLIGSLFGGSQRLTPRLQIVASPGTPNLNVPNEDARAVDLEDSNLFALNRFAGYDRWEDGTRITYGLDWGLDLPGLSLQANIGQSYRLSAKASLFPDGTGLASATSDIVGRTTLKYKRLLSLTHRYRLDKDNLSVRRNEIDATFGTDQTYATLSYLRLNRDIGATLEDLRDREEIRIGGRLQFARYWSVFGSTIVDLTDKSDDSTSLADGYQPIRHRLGIAYEDDCLSLGFTWKRDYDATGDARRGNSYQLRLSFRNLGR